MPSTTQTAGSWASAASTRPPTSRPSPRAGGQAGHREQPGGPSSGDDHRPRRTGSRDVAVARTCSVRPSCSSALACATTRDPEAGDRRRPRSRAPRPAARPAAHRRRRGSRSARGRHRCRAGRRRRGRSHPAPRRARRRRRSTTASAARCCRQARASASASRGRPSRGPGRAANTPGAEVAAGAQQVRGDDQGGRGRDVQQQHPPARVAPGAQPGLPAERRQPAQPGRSDVADGTEQVEHRDRGAGDAGAGPAAGRELAGDRGDTDGDQPDAGPRGAERDRAGDRQPAGDVGDRGERPDDERDHRPDQDRRSEAACPARSPCRRAARRGRTPPRCGCAGGRRRGTAAPRRRRTAPSSWSSRARPGCARRGSGRRARPPRGSR